MLNEGKSVYLLFIVKQSDQTMVIRKQKQYQWPHSMHQQNNGIILRAFEQKWKTQIRADGTNFNFPVLHKQILNTLFSVAFVFTKKKKLLSNGMCQSFIWKSWALLNDNDEHLNKFSICHIFHVAVNERALLENDVNPFDLAKAVSNEMLIAL